MFRRVCLIDCVDRQWLWPDARTPGSTSVGVDDHGARRSSELPRPATAIDQLVAVSETFRHHVVEEIHRMGQLAAGVRLGHCCRDRERVIGNAGAGAR